MPKLKKKRENKKRKSKKIFEFFEEHQCLNCSKMIPTPMLLCSSKCGREYDPEKVLSKFLDKMQFSKKSKKTMLLWYRTGKLPHLRRFYNLKERYISEDRWK